MESLLLFARRNGLTIDAVALSEGPGSYTGLRIGTSTAKGLCYGLNVPLIPVPTLEVLCEAAKSEIINHKFEITNGTLVPMIDARRMEVYTALYNGERENGERREAKAVIVESEASLLSFSTAVHGLSAQRSIYYFGDGASKCQAVLTQPNWHFIPGIVPEAQYMGTLAETITNHRSPITNHQLAYYEPYYLKEFIAAPSHVKGLS
jgi:tRNA threonylcarbamoyladenosine biosynthesis protein TsaB